MGAQRLGSQCANEFRRIARDFPDRAPNWPAAMSALGQKQTLEGLSGMSALPPKADIGLRAYRPSSDRLLACSSLSIASVSFVTSPSLFTFRRLGAPADHAERTVVLSDVTLNSLQNALFVKSSACPLYAPKADMPLLQIPASVALASRISSARPRRSTRASFV